MIHDASGIKYVASPLLQGKPVVHGFLTRVGGVSGTPYASLNFDGRDTDTKENVERNRALFHEAFPVPPGRLVTVSVGPTLADGLAGNLDPDTRTFEIVQRLVPEISTVTEDRIAAAMRGILERDRLIAEGASAVAVAAVLDGKVPAADGPIALVLSGANVDARVLKSIL